MEDLSRRVPMICGICGNGQFEYDNEDGSTSYKCSKCGKLHTKEELLEANDSKIDASLEDIKRELIDETKKELKEMFKDFK